jgi:hypothetical protein
MPNHVTTVCTVTGPSVARFREHHFTDRDGAPRFDFNTIIPTPEPISGTESSTDVTLGLMALNGQRDSNQFLQHLSLEEQISRATQGAAHTQAELFAWLKAHRPEALSKAERSRRAFDETGYLNWYEWNIAMWGTKWNAYDCAIRSLDNERLVFVFDTAWSFPMPVFQKLRLLYPDLVFDVASFDEGWGFACTGCFGGANDFTYVDASPELYRRVYGRGPDTEDDEECEVAN